MSSVRQIVEDWTARLQALAWPDGAAEDVFGEAVYPTHAAAIEALPRISRPFAVLQVQSTEQDEEEPSLYRLTLAIDVYVWQRQGFSGDSALIGSNRAGGVGSSQGAGLLEIEAALGQLARLGEDDGARRGYRIRSGDAAVEIPGIVGGVSRRYLVEAIATAEDSYPAPVFLNGVASGGGAVSLKFERPGSRSDYQGLTLRYASGSTPPASATAGTAVTISDESSGAQSHTPGAGTQSYSLFGRYLRQGVTSYSAAKSWTGAVS